MITDYEDIAEEIYRLREEKQKLQLESAGRNELKNPSPVWAPSRQAGVPLCPAAD